MFKLLLKSNIVLFSITSAVFAATFDKTIMIDGSDILNSSQTTTSVNKNSSFDSEILNAIDVQKPIEVAQRGVTMSNCSEYRENNIGDLVSVCDGSDGKQYYMIISKKEQELTNRRGQNIAACQSGFNEYITSGTIVAGVGGGFALWSFNSANPLIKLKGTVVGAGFAFGGLTVSGGASLLSLTCNIFN